MSRANLAKDPDEVAAMFDGVDRPRLLDKAGHRLFIVGHLRPQDLEGDLLANERVATSPDLAHTAFADLLF